MKLKEKFAKSGLSCDSKSRRRVNVTSKRANITAESIERGVTIEELESVGVPVFRYETQVTMHGKLPDLNSKRVGGYKCLIENGNGSIGIRYVAIDNEKKQLIQKACKLGNSLVSGHFNSKGFQLFQSARDKETILAAYEAFPRDLIHGSIYAGALQFGGYGLFIEIGSVDQANMDALLIYLCGMNEAQAREAIAKAEAKREAESAKRAVEYRQAMEKRKAEREALEARLIEAVQSEGTPASKFEPGSYRIASGFDESGAVTWKQVEFAKRGPVFCYKTAKTGKFMKYRGAFDKALGKRAFRESEPEPPKKKERPKQSKRAIDQRQLVKPSDNSKLAEELKTCVDWQEPEVYVTNKGKPVERVCGVPSDAFWLLWKHEKQAIKALGVTIFASKSEGTGEYKTVKGKTFEVKRKQWEVSLWKPEALGFSFPEVEQTNCPF